MGTSYNACKMRWLVLAIAALFAAAAAQAPLPATLDRDAQRWVDTTLKKMTLDEMVGQVLMPRFSSVYTSFDSDIYDNLSIASVPLLTAADFEWGVGMRIEGATRFPRAMAFGAAGDEHLASEAGRITALEGRALGVHVNFAPVADVNNNPRNPVINIRSYGEDPASVGKMTAAFAQGLQGGGMIATLKHFPGHGDTGVDSHLGLPVVPHERERLDRVELAPFRAGIAAGADAVMVAHVEMPSLDKTSGPATFSQPVVTGLLREQLGFKGLIVSDAMNMNAVTELGTAGENAVKAFNAGIDIILDSRDTMGAFEGLKKGVESGQITRERLDA